MSSAEQPGKGNPKPQGTPTGDAAAAVVEKTLGQLESMTGVLAQEIGTPQTRSAVAPPGTGAATPSPPAVAAAQAPTPPATPSGAVEELPRPLAPAATDAVQMPLAADPAVAAEPAAQSVAPVPESTPSPATDQVAPAAQPAEASASASEAPAGAEQAGTQSEIDHEINQALQQLQTGQPAATSSVVTEPAAPANEKPPLHKRLARLILRVFDALLTPLVLLLVLVDLPLRWMPTIVRQLLGYIAVGTTLMAGALWAYLLLRAH